MAVPSLREARVPNQLEGAVACGPLIEAASDAVLLRVPRVGRFLVRGDGDALVQRAAGATEADLRCFLEGPVAAAAGILRGGLVLRAASVSVDGRAVVICGTSAVGKSALVAALGLRGHAVLADAVTVISGETAAAAPAVSPLAPEPVLWPDTVGELGLAGESGRRVRPRLAARAFPLGPEPAPTPPAVVVFLSANATYREPDLSPVTGTEKIEAILANRWHGRLVEPFGRSAAQFRIAARVAAAGCVRLVRPRSGAPPARLAALIEELVP
jgi:hypothetical protein